MNTEPNYSKMEEILKLINSKYIVLNQDQKSYNVHQLLTVLEKLTEIMKDIDPLFKKLFKRLFFGGSYYHDLKIEKPNEFDIDLVLDLPATCESCKRGRCGCVDLCSSNKPGWLWLRIKDGFCPSLKVFMKDGYVETNLVLNWLKSILYKALTKLGGTNVEVKTDYRSESGPALILVFHGIYGDVDVDLAPSFRFYKDDWPREGYINNPTSEWEFFIVPKYNESQRYWRPSFQAQESQLLCDNERLKPSLRLLKKMRNSLGHVSVASYYLKTIGLHNLENIKWTGTLSDTFMVLLCKYQECLQLRKIPYYWNHRNNLLGTVHKDTLQNHYNEVTKKIRKIEKYYKTDPCIVASIILTRDEYNNFRKDPEVLKLCSSKVNKASSLHMEDKSGNLSIRNKPNSTREQCHQTQPNTNTSSAGTSWWTIGAIATGLIAGGALLYNAMRRDDDEPDHGNRPANSRRNSEDDQNR